MTSRRKWEEVNENVKVRGNFLRKRGKRELKKM